MNNDVQDPVVASQLAQLRKDYDEGLLTDKGYAKRYSDIINGMRLTPTNGVNNAHSPSATRDSSLQTNWSTTGRERSVSVSSTAALYTQYPQQNGFVAPQNWSQQSQPVTDLIYPQQGVRNFSNGSSGRYSMFPGQFASPAAPVAAIQSNATAQGFIPQVAPPVIPQRLVQPPLSPRDMSSINQVEKFDSLPLILRHRAKTYGKDVAIVAISARGKETNSISWEKLYAKAEKVAQQITRKSGLYKGDRVTLIYQEFEVIPFAIAFFGCLLAGMVALPISNELRIKDIIQVMHMTQSKLCLTSDSVHKNFEKYDGDKSIWHDKVTMWRTEEMGSYQMSKRHDPPALNLPDLAYIEFSKYPMELKGVVMSHKTIMHQMSNLTRIISSSPNFGSSIQRAENVYKVRRDSILCSCDIRSSSGLVLGLLFTIYTGTMLVWIPTSHMDVSGLYANLVTKYRSTILLSDLLGLKSVAFNYQADPSSTRKFDRKKTVDLSCVKWCIVCSLTVNNEVLEIIADRWLRPLGCENARNVIAPALSLSEFGGMIIAIRDWIGKEDKLSTDIKSPVGDDDNEPYSASDLSEVLIDKDSLSTNTVRLISDRPPSQTANFDSRAYSKYIRVGAFGFPLLDATLAIVNPENSFLSAPMEVGEIWVTSPCLSGGYWNMNEQTNRIFRARCRGNEGFLNQEFLRTGLLGFIYNGKVYVLGLYEDRFRQRVTWIDRKEQKNLGEIQEEAEDEEDEKQNNKLITDNEYRYHYSDHISNTIFKKVSQVECSTFDIFVNGEYVPVIIIETALAARQIPSNEIDYVALDAMAVETFQILEKVHKVRLFCCAFTTVQGLPRAIKSGRTEIANMLCKTKFLQGNLRLSYVKYNIKNSLSNIVTGTDILGGIWSQYASTFRRNSIPENVDRQYTGLDRRIESVDERSHARLTDFKTLLDVLKWRNLNQPDTLAYAVINDNKKNLSWRKFDDKIASICHLILKKTFLRPKNHVILMYNLSEEYICTLFACFTLGLIPIPMAPFDTSRIQEEAGSYYRIIKDFDVKMVLTNHDVESAIFKNKIVNNAIKALFVSKKPIVVKSTSKTKTVKNMSDLRSNISRYQAEFNFRDPNTTVLVTLEWSTDGRRIGVKYSHQILMNLCKILKETFKMSSFNSILTAVPHFSGLGFIQTALLGVYLGCSTYLFPTNGFYTSPMTFFNSLANYKIKDTYVTREMLAHATTKSTPSKTFQLDKLQNLMISFPSRPNSALLGATEKYLASTKVQSLAINAVYSHRFNPIITARSYLNLKPFVIYLDAGALRQGFISIVQSTHPNALRLEDSGVVLCCTQIAIVNPETEKICKVGEFGEIWVYSEGNALGYTNGIKRNDNQFLISQFNGKLDELEFTYLRTGDLGFIHTVSQPSIDGTPFDVQFLYILGHISETFEVLGLHYFAGDVEETVEQSHSDIYRGASLVFKSEEYTVVICCPKKKVFLASLVPLIFKNVLNKHQLMIDIVGFLPLDQFEVSKTNEKKRSTMIHKWINNQLHFMNVYGVNYGENSVIETVRQMEGFEEISIPSEKSSEVNSIQPSMGTALTDLGEKFK